MRFVYGMIFAHIVFVEYHKTDVRQDDPKKFIL